MSYYEYRSGESLMEMRLEGSKEWSHSQAQMRQAGLTGTAVLARLRHRLENKISTVTVTLTRILERLGRLESFPLTG